MTYEIARANIQSLRDWHDQNVGSRNEATTRLHLIDRLFFDCLAWDREETLLEEPHNGQFADYTFLAPRPIMIVEAKKEGAYFEIPAGHRRLESSIPSISRDNPNLKSALEQVSEYCQGRGVPIGVVTNGHQLVALIAARNDGTPPLEARAIVFTSIDQMLEHFLDLWQTLSKPGIQDRLIFQRLVGEERPDIPPKLSSTISNYPGTKQRNIFQTDLQIVSDLVLEDLVRTGDLETRFLSECYAQSGALSQYALISKSILEARYAALADATQPGPTTTPAVLRNGISQELLAESMSRRPILLIGDVGVGKTTFIRHLVKVEAAALFEDAIALYLDFGSQATLTRDLRAFVVEDMISQLLTTYNVDVDERNFVHGVYHGDLERFSRSIYADLRESDPQAYREREVAFLEERLHLRADHLQRSLEHIVRGRRKQVVIFLDNADQRDSETQQEVFLIAQELADRWPATVFVALRPETFYRSMRSGTLSGYHPKAFTISPPRIDEVLKRRLGFALRLTSGGIPIRGLSEGTTIHLESLDAIIRVFLITIDWSDEIIELIDNISGGNVRLALDLVKGFFGSGHVDTEKIVRIYNESHRYYVPMHEFLRAVIYGDSVYYDPQRSPVTNIFDVAFSDPREHFIVPILLSIFTLAARAGTGEGFVETAAVYDSVQGLGFTVEQIDAALVRAHARKLLETSGRRIPVTGEPMPPAFRATTVGAYHVDRIPKLFPYIDAIVTDTPIFDPNARRAIISSAEFIVARLDRADVFRGYLDRIWASLPAGALIFDWPSCSQAVRSQIALIRDRVARREEE